MKLIDRISLHKLLTTIFGFILSIMKIIYREPDSTVTPNKRKKILPWKKEK